MREHQSIGSRGYFGKVASSIDARTSRRASVAAMDFAVNVLGGATFIHSIHPDNTRSQTIAARLGSVNRARFRCVEAARRRRSSART